MKARQRSRPFRKVLIANRGEIACRIIRTCREMGIRTVAVFSEADQSAVHVDAADEAFAIGPPAANESYLRPDVLLEAARKTRAQAIHPGYGFLSENAAFAKAVENEGLVFVGPPAEAIDVMGDKLAAKELAAKVGVNVVPGHAKPARTANQASRMANAIGHPVMLKAAAGGGGKGMRIAYNDDEVREAFPLAAGEARSSFGDGRIFVERYFANPRHIEIQVLADAHGNCISLGERECSIQRRHQKIFEEAPAPRLDGAIRQRMEEQAIALALAVHYRSAGTVEFILDSEGDFHFLEMNTRLQVEHPVTELVTGIDLVAQMLRIAAGEPLSFAQEDVRPARGWAIEARVCAEDPERGFVPSIGRIRRLEEPSNSGETAVRIDSGVVEGSEITPYYDPMIAKVVAFGRDRNSAVQTMQTALDAFYIRGPRTNLAFLSDVVRRARFRKGQLDTGFLEAEYPEGYQPPPPAGEIRDTLIAVAAFMHRVEEQRSGIRFRADTRSYVIALADDAWPCTVCPAVGGYDVSIDDRQLAVRSTWRPGQVVFIGQVNLTEVAVQIDPAPAGWRLSHGGVQVTAVVRPPETAALAVHMPVKRAPVASNRICSPMPGLVLAVMVKEGDEVRTGQVVAIVEAMKAENLLRAETDGVVKQVGVREGDNIAADDVIVEFA